MRLVWIEPARREVAVIEGDPGLLCRDVLLPPPGLVDLDPGTALVVCTVGVVGSNVELWWHHELSEIFGGQAFVGGIDAAGNLTGVAEGTWLRTRRAVEFLGIGDAALPRLRELVRKAMGEDAPDPRQGSLELEPRK